VSRPATVEIIFKDINIHKNERLLEYSGGHGHSERLLEYSGGHGHSERLLEYSGGHGHSAVKG
jgi:hypothetical protein